MTDVTYRPATEEDLEELASLLQREAIEQGREPTLTAERLRAEWDSPLFDVSRHTCIAMIDGAIVATSSMWPEKQMAYLGGYVHPDHRGRGIATRIFDTMLDAAITEGCTYALTGYQDHHAPAKAFVESRDGFTYERSFLRMRHPAPATIQAPTPIPNVELFQVEHTDDFVRLLIEVRDGSFVDHWEFQPFEEVEVRHWLATGELDQSLTFFARVDGTSAAVCVNESRHDIHGVHHGYLGPIGTLRPFRGRGVARALLRHSVRALADRGATDVFLGVDSINPFEAYGLYERNGFVRVGEWRMKRKELP